jgi:hypothetical protein
MARQIVGADVRFGFDDAGTQRSLSHFVNQYFTNQLARNRLGILTIKRAW